MIPRPLADPLAALAHAPEVRPSPAAVRLRRRASRILARARRGGRWQRALKRLVRLLAAAPGDPHLARVIGHVVTLSNDRALAEAVWRGIATRDPQAVEPSVLHLQSVLRHRGLDAGEALVRRRLDGPRLLDARDREAAGLLLERVGRRADAEAAFAAATAADPRAPLPWARLSALLHARGQTAAAAETLARGLAQSGDASLRRRPAAPPPLPRTAGLEWVKPLDRLLARGLRQPPLFAHPPGTIGRTILVGGSLGGGGAERQMVATALGLAHTLSTGDVLAGLRVTGPVSLLCRRLDGRRGHDFFLPQLARAGIPVRDYLSLPRFGADPRRSHLAAVRRDVALLPDRMREGTERLTDRFIELAPQVVHIWQDGMILAVGLAALLAGVPRIVLNVRTLPPSLRADRWKPEALPLYQGLLRSPAVRLTANSARAARAYEAWLELAPGAVSVVPNGVAALHAEGDPADEARWATFAQAAGPGFTVGGVMRFDGNKRPLEWLEAAERLLRVRPDARFVLVGDGELGGIAREFARHRGLEGRTLFVGRSAHVGFWLSRCDALMLTSRFEGTPNVLIEAQLAGLPVVTTPAGAAAETIVPDVTGIVLDEAETLDVRAAAEALDRIAGWSDERRAHVAAAARAHAGRAYSRRTMLERTVEVFAP